MVANPFVRVNRAVYGYPIPEPATNLIVDIKMTGAYPVGLNTMGEETIVFGATPGKSVTADVYVHRGEWLGEPHDAPSKVRMRAHSQKRAFMKNVLYPVEPPKKPPIEASNDDGDFYNPDGLLNRHI